MTRAGRSAILLCSAFVWSAALTSAQTTAQSAIDRGAELYREGRFDEAADAFSRAADLDPGSLAVWESLGWAYRKGDRPDDAREVWLRVLKVDPNRAALWNQVAAIDIEQENWSAAAESLERSLRLEPSDSHVRSRLAMVLESGERWEEAADAYEELVRHDPTSLTAIKRLASFHERAGDDVRAQRVLEEASARLPDYAHIFRIHISRLEARQADRALAEGDFSRAVAGYQEAIRSNPREPDYLENLGWAHRRAGELAEAVEVWRRARERAPDDAQLVRHLADAVRESGDGDEARELYLEAWEMAPGSDPVVLFRLAEDALANANVERAIAWSARLFEFPNADDVWSERVAGIFARWELPEPGIAVFRARRGLTRAPRKTAAAESRLHALAGRQARRDADLEGALESYREALRLDGSNRVALRDLGWTQWILADWEACAETWEHLAALDPNDTGPLNLLTHLYLYRRTYDDAIRTATASLAMDPDQPEQSLKLARALHWSGRYHEGKALAKTLASEQPDHLDIQRFWAELLMQYHDFERGLAAWQRVLALGASDPRAQYFYVKSLYETGHYDTALAEGRRFVATTEPHPGLLRLLADDAWLRGEPQETGGWLKRLVERSPENVELWIELAELQAELGSRAVALETVERAKDWHPDSVDLETTRANFLRREGRPEEAFEIYRALAKDHPDSREVFWGYFQTATETERHRLALEILALNRSTFLKHYEVELERARLLYATGDGNGARDLLSASAEPEANVFTVPILLYHGLGDHQRTPAMSIEQFDSQMRALSEHGYQSITVSELDRITRGELPAPARPIVITFDDARIDSFVLADPILERHRMKATMFVPTGLTRDGHPFFADWSLLERYAANGRWELQAHGHHAHDLIEIDGEGTRGSFLVNRMWLPAEGRLETEEEYLYRVDADYRRVQREIESRIPGISVVGYAFPFSEAGQESDGNYQNASAVNESYLGNYYRFGFVQDANGYNEIGPDASPFLKRYSVPRELDGEGLVRHLAREHPRVRALEQLAKIEMWTGLYGRARDTWARVIETSPVLADDAAYYLASIDFQLGSLRSARSQIEAAKRAEAGVRPTDVANLERRISWEESIRIEPRFALSDDSAERVNRSQGIGFTVGSLAPLQVGAFVGSVNFEQGSLDPLEALEGELGMRLRASPHVFADARVRQRRAQTSDADSTNYWGTIGLEGDRAELVVRAGREDVETLRARREGILLDSYQLQQVLRFTPRIWTLVDARYGEYTDGNAREDLVGRITFKPWLGSGWRFGASGGWTDSRVQSDAYYTPEELRYGRGLVGFARSSPSGWSIDTAVELGWGRDTLRGDRFTAQARGRTVQAWTDRLRSSFEWTFSSSPGYRYWGLAFGLHFGFTDPVEIDQSSFTAQ